MIFCANNLITEDNITVNEESLALPPANLVDDQVYKKCQFEDDIVIDLGSATLIDTIAIVDSSKAITIEANATDSWGAPSYSKVLALITGTDIYLNFISETYRYWRITASGVTRIGNAYLGNRLLIPNPTYGSIPNEDHTDIKNSTPSGQKYITPGVKILDGDYDFQTPTKVEYDRMKTFTASEGRYRGGVFAQTESNLSLFPPYFAELIFNFTDRGFTDRYIFKLKTEEMK